MQAVGIVQGWDHHQLPELGIREVGPGSRRGPPFVGKRLLVVHQARRDDADADCLVVLVARGRVDVVHRHALDRRAKAQRDRLVHRAVIDDGDVDFLIALLGLEPRDRVGRVAGHEIDLDVVRLFERREDFLAHGVFKRAAVPGYHKLLLRAGRARECSGDRHPRQHCNQFVHQNLRIKVVCPQMSAQITFGHFRIFTPRRYFGKVKLPRRS